jgi:antitoxin HicB
VKAFRIDARKRRIELTDHAGRTLGIPFARLDPPPQRAADIAHIGFDPHVGHHGVVYRLTDGTEGALLWDHCLDYNADPAYVEAALLRQLTAAADEALTTSGLAKREVARRLGTSPTQLYRLLDADNSKKSIGQLLALLHVLGRKAELVIDAA